MRVPDIDRVEPGETSSTPLRQNSVEGTAGQIQAPVLGKGRDELHRTVPNFAASQIQPVERSVSRNCVKDARALINHRSGGNSVGAQERALVAALAGRDNIAESVGPQLFSRLGVQSKHRALNAGHIDHASNAVNRGDVRRDNRGSERRQTVGLILELGFPHQSKFGDIRRV